jgi:hypothetical protein
MNQWGITPFEYLIEPDTDKLNDVEQLVIDTCPALQRIATSQKPVLIQGWIPKNHNCDFLLLDSMFIEVKGHIRDIMYRPMLKHMPYWLKRRYHVMVCNNSAKERERMMEFCTRNGVSASEGTVVPPWLIQRAIDLGPMQHDETLKNYWM